MLNRKLSKQVIALGGQSHEVPQLLNLGSRTLLTLQTDVLHVDPEDARQQLPHLSIVSTCIVALMIIWPLWSLFCNIVSGCGSAETHWPILRVCRAERLT